MASKIGLAYAVEFPSADEQMPEVIDRVVETLYALEAITQAREAKVRICMQEAIVNAMRHGNKGQQDKLVRVEVILENCMCSIKVYDEGDGFDPTCDNLPDSGSEGGRGIQLMRHFMDSVDFDGKAKCLELRIFMPQKA